MENFNIEILSQKLKILSNNRDNLLSTVKTTASSDTEILMQLSIDIKILEDRIAIYTNLIEEIRHYPIGSVNPSTTIVMPCGQEIEYPYDSRLRYIAKELHRDECPICRNHDNQERATLIRKKLIDNEIVGYKINPLYYNQDEFNKNYYGDGSGITPAEVVPIRRRDSEQYTGVRYNTQEAAEKILDKIQHECDHKFVMLSHDEAFCVRCGAISCFPDID